MTQCTKSSASRSVKARASSLEVDGTPDHERAGDVSAPRQVYWASMAAPSAHGVAMAMPEPPVMPEPAEPPLPLTAAPAVELVVVMIDAVWFGPAGRSVRPSCEQAVAANAAEASRTARRFTARER
jgi:hypothetical protein